MLEIDDSRFPLIRMELSIELTTDDLEQYGRYMEGRFDDRRRFAGLVVIRDLAMPSVAILKQLAEWARAHESSSAHVLVGSSIVATSPLVRGAIAFTNKMAPSPAPQAVFSTEEEAEAWALAKLDEAGLAIPA